MEIRDLASLSLVLGILIITSCVVYISYFLVRTLKSITHLADDLDEAAQNIKNKTQLKALVAIPALLATLVSKVIKIRRG